METNATKELVHGRGPHGASHPRWSLRRESGIWGENVAVRANLVPLAAEMCQWLGQKSPGLSLQSRHLPDGERFFTNPYTYHASSIGAVLCSAINSAHDFVTSKEHLPPFEAEAQRLRLHTELVLYVARFCEATIKQMLHCTSIPRRLYSRASLGQLLSADCDRCRKQARQGHDIQTHDISLLGALAHQYFLCHTLESCVIEHLDVVGRRRNIEAAHSDALDLNIRNVEASRAELAGTLQEVGHELGHMAQHIGEIEEKMLAEIELRIAHQPALPSVDALMNIPSRPDEESIAQARAGRQ